MTSLRRLESRDWPVLREARLHALGDAPEAFGSSLAEEEQHPEDWWRASTERLGWFVAEDGGAVVGLAAGLPAGEGRSCPEVISMWVEVSHRGTGTADRLLRAVVAWARDQGADEVVLAVADGNDRARHFYERAGFRLTGAGQPLRSRPEVCTHEMRLALGP